MKKSILFILAGTKQQASPRYRVIQYIPKLKKAGFSIEVHYPTKKQKGIMRAFSSFIENRNIIQKSINHDIVFIQKRLFNKSLVKKLKENGAKLVFDFDDSILASQQEKSFTTRKRTIKRFKSICKHADLIIAGNKHLAQQTIEPTGTVRVLPTVVNIDRYLPQEQPHIDNSIIIGWIGQPVNHEYIIEIEPALRQLAEKYPNLMLHVISRGKFTINGVNVKNIEWNEKDETQLLRQIDIGIMPIPDNEWSKGKCALKAIQYMAAGIPVVCSNIGANREVVRDKTDGYLVDTLSEWESALEILISNHELRYQMGTSGRTRVQKHYTLDTAAELMSKWLSELTSHTP